MKRLACTVVLLMCVVFSLTRMAAAARVSIMENTKHNLSSGSTATYRAAGDSTTAGANQICVFCHTPHGGNTNAPLWNKSAVTGPYTVYTSDVLGAAGLNYPAADYPTSPTSPVDVHVKTRICLSCHDGTIALGSVANSPSPLPGGSIPMSGGVDYLSNKAAGYIGTDLSDDHPVSIKYVGTSKDHELNDTITGNVRVYDSADGKKKTASGTTVYVECTSCHNAHDNQYGNFLVGPNDGSKICLNCHTKWIGSVSTGSAHDKATNPVTHAYSPPTGGTTPPTTLGTTVAGVKCMTCHFSHKTGITGFTSFPEADPNAGYGRYLLTFKEEQSCYNSPNRWNNSATPCHGSNSEAVSDIKSLVASGKTSKHQVDSNTSVAHEVTEGKTVGWFEKQHVECADCHNPHTAGNVKHVQNPPQPIPAPMPDLTTAATSPLYGTGGIRVITPPSWGTPGTGSFEYLEPVGGVDYLQNATGASYEFQICLKCHSEFAWYGATSGVPTAPSLSAAMTDQSVEFDTTNASFHPVEGPNGSTQGTYVAPWANTSQTMYCSDCHNNSTSGGPQGSHGSNEKFILVKPFSDSPSNPNGGAEQPTGELCYLCHDETTYRSPSNTATGGTGFQMQTSNYNLHARHAWLASNTGVPNPWGYKCVNCHIRIPHGWNRQAMVVLASDSAPYNNGARINSISFNTGAYLKTSCTTVSGCHQ